VGGNVSLYNEGSEGPIYPTPIVGMVGWLPDPERVPATGFRQAGHEIALIGPYRPAWSGSEMEKLSGSLGEALPELDLEEQGRALAVIRDLARDGLLASAHDVSEGGLGVALSECCIGGQLGARVELPHTGFAPMVFGEGAGGVVVSAPAEAMAEIERRAAAIGFFRLGAVGGDTLEIWKSDLAEAGEAAIATEGVSDEVAEAFRNRLAEAVSTASLSIPVADLSAAFESGIPAKFS
jgi:phosphoribosylformylglycinamidine synthase